MGFSDICKKWGDDTLTWLGDTQKKLAVRSFQYCVSGSPVLTGRYRASFRLAVGVPDPTSVGPQPITMAATPLAAPSVATAAANIAGHKLGQDLIVSNNVPYVGYIEVGSSKKAPNGVIILAATKAVIDLTKGTL